MRSLLSCTALSSGVNLDSLAGALILNVSIPACFKVSIALPALNPCLALRSCKNIILALVFSVKASKECISLLPRVSALFTITTSLPCLNLNKGSSASSLYLCLNPAMLSPNSGLPKETNHCHKLLGLRLMFSLISFVIMRFGDNMRTVLPEDSARFKTAEITSVLSVARLSIRPRRLFDCKIFIAQSLVSPEAMLSTALFLRLMATFCSFVSLPLATRSITDFSVSINSLVTNIEADLSKGIMPPFFTVLSKALTISLCVFFPIENSNA